jgi:hypothetical protein
MPSPPFHPSDFVNSFFDNDRLSTSSPNAFFDIRWYYSISLGFSIPPFLNKLVFNRVSVPHIAVTFWMCCFSPEVDGTRL